MESEKATEHFMFLLKPNFSSLRMKVFQQNLHSSIFKTDCEKRRLQPSVGDKRKQL